MSIVGFGFTRISAEKKNNARGAVKINNNITVKNVEELKTGAVKGRGAAKITFSFTTTYGPEIGSIELEGSVVVMLPDKEHKILVETWDKKKIMAPEVGPGIINYLLEKCNVEALLMSRELGLPSPIKLPRVEAVGLGKKKEKGAGKKEKDEKDKEKSAKSSKSKK